SVVTSGRRRTRQIDPTRRRPRPRDQPRSSTLKGLEQVLPRNGKAAPPVRSRQDQIPWRIGLNDDERVRRTGCGGHDIPRDNGLELRYDARRAWRAAVVNRVPAVPACTASAHLRNPRPDVFGWGIDRNRVCRREKWVGHQFVGAKRTMPFGGGREAGYERHNTMEGAFAVPAPRRGRCA